MHGHSVVLAFVATTVVGTACTGGIEEAADVLGSPSATPSASVLVTSSPPRSISTSPSGSTSPTEAPIVVRTPRRDDDVLSPVVVSGTAISASGEVLVEILDVEGMELAAMNARIDCGSSCRGAFRAQLAFYSSVRQPGTIQVFEVGPGGSTEHLVEVDVTLVPGV